MSVNQPSKSQKQIWHQHGFTTDNAGFLANHEVRTVTVTLTDNNKEVGLVEHIFNIA